MPDLRAHQGPYFWAAAAPTAWTFATVRSSIVSNSHLWPTAEDRPRAAAADLLGESLREAERTTSSFQSRMGAGVASPDGSAPQE